MNALGPWPLATDYIEAVQQAGSIGVDELASASVRAGLMGMPAAASGQNAVVFPFDAPGQTFAVKCFTRLPDDATRHRYRLLTRLVRTRQAPFADVEWHDRGIRVGSEWYPVVQMPWLPGVTLDLGIAERLDDEYALHRMAQSFRDVAAGLSAMRVAHGDLQHGNILVESDRALHLVDFDGVWTRGGELLVPDEVGHRSYQHPVRLRTGAWGPWIDVVPALVIYTSILAVAAEPELWSRFHDGENLLYRQDDLAEPASSEVFARIGQSPSDEVRQLNDLLARCVVVPPGALGSFASLLTGAQPGVVGTAPVGIEAPGRNPEWIPAPLPASDPTAESPEPAAEESGSRWRRRTPSRTGEYEFKDSRRKMRKRRKL